MFDWFWEFLYGLTKSILRLIDGLISCINKLCGIEPVAVDGVETDLLSYMLRSDAVADGFKIAAITGFIVLVFFTIARIIMVVAKEKPDISPLQVCGKAFRSLLLFLFIPLIMLTLVWSLNALMQALYTATMGNMSSLGMFLFKTFSQDAQIIDQSAYETVLNGANGYWNTDLVEQAINLSDFDYLFSWATGIVLLIVIANSLLSFVDRAISLGVLFVVSPFSVASSVLDDGARFKLWREQLLIKFLTGYGIILYLNVYCLLVSLVTPSNVVFFENSFINGLFKLLIIVGGGLAMNRSMALIGNLVSQGAGSREAMTDSLGRMGASAAVGGVKMLGQTLLAGGKKLLGGKKGDGKKTEGAESKPEENGNNGNEGEKFESDPKYNNNNNNLNNRLRNPSNDNNGGGNGNNNNNGGGRKNNGNNNNNDDGAFRNNNNDVNKNRGDIIRKSLQNPNSINDYEEDMK